MADNSVGRALDATTRTSSGRVALLLDVSWTRCITG